MAIEVGNNTYPFVQEVSITVGNISTNPTKTLTATVSGMLDVTQLPHVTSNQLTDQGVGIIGAWFSNPSNAGTTLNIKISNTSLLSTLTTDPVTFKVVVL